MKLPEAFLEKMKVLLETNEYDAFVNSFGYPKCSGLRINTLKVGIGDFLRISPFKLRSVPWTSDGFYYEEGQSPGRHPYYHAGLYYIQEPSAMLPGAVMDAKPGERILDLCAAPGGKSVQLAAGMRGQGLLVANDINADRVKALVRNMELCGVRNAIVTNESPERLCGRFPEFFDAVLADAPCSGEGMFRKDEDAIRNWSGYNCARCAGMQREILESAHLMLKPGGRLVYSTCTFSPEEDERMIAWFMDTHHEYRLLDTPRTAGIADGRPEWADGRPELCKTARLWPHRLEGEGHYTAVLQKGCSALNREEAAGGRQHAASNIGHEMLSKHRMLSEPGMLSDIIGLPDVLAHDMEGWFTVVGTSLYCLPCPYPPLDRIRVAKFGWYLGEISEEKRLAPSHSMAASLHKSDFTRTVDFPADSREIRSYLKGETVMVEGMKGLTAVCVDGYTAGWAKQTGDMLKNMYPKGWRMMR